MSEPGTQAAAMSHGNPDSLSFNQRLIASQRASGSVLCVGLDPLPDRIPGGARNLQSFCQTVVEATADLVCTFKPQIAHFAALGAERELESLIHWIHEQAPGIPVILDAKRGDIGSTAERYAIEAFDRYNADAVTVNPYTAPEGLEPFLNRPERGAIVLCRTSNTDTDWIQCHPPEDPLYARIALRAQNEWNRNDNVLLVAGATHAQDLARIRTAAPDVGLLVPGVGTQDGDLAAVLRNGSRNDGFGLVINSSRSIIYAGNADAASIRQAALDFNQQVARSR